MARFLSGLNPTFAPSNSIILSADKLPNTEEAFIQTMQVAFKPIYSTTCSPSQSHVSLVIVARGSGCGVGCGWGTSPKCTYYSGLSYVVSHCYQKHYFPATIVGSSIFGVVAHFIASSLPKGSQPTILTPCSDITVSRSEH